MRKSLLILFLCVCGQLCATNIDSLFVAKIADEQVADSTIQQRFDYSFFEAVRQRQLGNILECKLLLDSCNKLIPKQAAVYYEYFELYSSAQLLEEALQNLQIAIKLAPDNDQYLETYLNIQLMQKHFDEAIVGYERLLEKHPDEELYMRILLDLYEATNSSSDMLAMLDKLENVSGVSENISFRRISVYVNKNQAKPIIKEVNKLIETFPLEARYRALLGDVYLAQNKTKKALKCYDEALAIDSCDGNTYMSLASYAEQCGDTVKAGAYKFKALQDTHMLLADKSQWMFSYISELTQNSDTIQADSVFATVIALHPHEPDLYDFYGAYLEHVGRKQAAKKAYRKAVELDPQLNNSWQQLYFLSSDTAEGLDVINEVLNVFPNSEWWNMAKLYSIVSDERYTEALVFIDEVKDLPFSAETKAQFFSMKGDILQRVNAPNDSVILAYECALQLDMQSANTQNNYAYFLAEHGGDLRRAESLGSLAVKAEPDNATYLDTYAWVLFRRGEYRLAKFYQEKAVKFSESAPLAEIYEHYGDILYMLGDVDGAVEQWQLALKCDGVSPLVVLKIQKRMYLEK